MRNYEDLDLDIRKARESIEFKGKGKGTIGITINISINYCKEGYKYTKKHNCFPSVNMCSVKPGCGSIKRCPGTTSKEDIF